MRWIEVNVERPSSVSKDDYLTKLVRPILDGFMGMHAPTHTLLDRIGFSDKIFLE